MIDLHVSEASKPAEEVVPIYMRVHVHVVTETIFIITAVDLSTHNAQLLFSSNAGEI